MKSKSGRFGKHQNGDHYGTEPRNCKMRRERSAKNSKELTSRESYGKIIQPLP